MRKVGATFMNSISLPILVHAYETDFGGVVSNTRYLEFLERGRYALLHAAGLPVEQTWRENGFMAIVRRIEADYLNFARHEEQLTLTTRVSEWSGASAIVAHEITRDDDGASNSARAPDHRVSESRVEADARARDLSRETELNVCY